MNTLSTSPAEKVVTNFSDSGTDSLRQAIISANTSPGNQVIQLEEGTYTLSIPGSNEDASANGDLDIFGNGELTIIGLGLGATIDATGLDERVFHILDNAILNLENITIKGGRSLGFENGGGIYNGGTLNLSNSSVLNNSALNGAGLYNIGTATVSNSTISGNSTLLQAPNRGGGGGIVNSGGNLTVVGSTISSNNALNGGGLVSTQNSHSVIRNSTLSENFAVLDGGAISNIDSTLNIASSTIFDNSAGEDGGGIFTGGFIAEASLSLVNTIVSNNIGNDIVNGDALRQPGTITSGGYNLIGNGDDIAGLINGVNGDQVGTATTPIDPRLAPLADNGGSTFTHALLPDSPAIDVANPTDFPETDQRGVSRPQGAAPDIGSFELMSPVRGSLFFSLVKGMTLQDTFINNEDIVHFNGTETSVWFDGSDLGLNRVSIDAFDVMGDGTILMSFDNSIRLLELGRVDDSDIVKFTPTSIGESTAGNFSLYFDGSDVGLTKPGEDIDAMTRLSNGDLIVSSKSSFNVPGVKGRDEDLIRFTPITLGEDTSGIWSMYFDGSDVRLAAKRENLDGVSLNESGQLLLSTSGNFDVPGLTGADEDGFIFNPTLLGTRTVGDYEPNLFFDGSSLGLRNNDIVAVDFGNI